MCLGTSLCYLEEDYIEVFFNKESTRDDLGIPSSVGNFTGCSSVVGQAFANHLDKWRLPAQFYVSNLLERGIRVLLYSGMVTSIVSTWKIIDVCIYQVPMTGSAIGWPIIYGVIN